MELRFERVLPCAPEIAFSLISDPDRMNLWSLATVRARAKGDGDHPGGVGALRQVALRRRVLEEVVEIAEPPLRFAYRVVGGAPVRSHLGQIRLTPAPGGTHLDWHVDLKLSLPGMASVARRWVVPPLEQSLDRLVEVARRAEPGPLPPVRSLYEDEDLPALHEEAESVLRDQRELAAELLRAGDPRAPIVRGYEVVSEAWIRAGREGRFAHPGWALRMLLRLWAHFFPSLARFLHRAEGPVEDHWHEVFTGVAPTAPRGRRRRESSLRALRRGMRVRIEEDLPRAFAEVYLGHYADRCDYARFRGDALRAGRAEDAALARLGSELARPLGARVLHRVLPAFAREAFVDPRPGDLDRRRRRAFERGGRLVRLVREQSGG